MNKIKRVKIINKFVKITQSGGELGKLNNSFFKLLFLVIFFNLLSFASFGEPYTENGVKYSFNNGTLTISKDEGVSDDNMPEREVSENGVQNAMSSYGGILAINKVIIKAGITSIGDMAFYDCSALTSMTIPDGVESIGNSVFRYCGKLTSITIPNSVTSIGNNTFYECNALESIIIPNSVTSIGYYAFTWCDSLQYVYFSGTAGEWNSITKNKGNGPLFNATIHYPNNTLTVNKVWNDNSNSSLRSKPQLVLYVKKSGSSGYNKIDNGGEKDDTKYVQGKFSYNVDDDQNKWQCKIEVFNHEEGSTYAVGEKRMEGYTSDAYVD